MGGGGRVNEPRAGGRPGSKDAVLARTRGRRLRDGADRRSGRDRRQRPAADGQNSRARAAAARGGRSEGAKADDSQERKRSREPGRRARGAGSAGVESTAPPAAAAAQCGQRAARGRARARRDAVFFCTRPHIGPAGRPDPRAGLRGPQGTPQQRFSSNRGCSLVIWTPLARFMGSCAREGQCG